MDTSRGAPELKFTILGNYSTLFFDASTEVGKRRVKVSGRINVPCTLQIHRAAYFDPVLSAHIKERTHFDAMISLWMLDFGPYLAHRVFEAPLIYLQVVRFQSLF